MNKTREYMTVVPQSKQERDELFEVALTRSIDTYNAFGACMEALDKAVQDAGIDPESKVSAICDLLHASVGYGIATVTGLLEGLSQSGFDTEGVE